MARRSSRDYPGCQVHSFGGFSIDWRPDSTTFFWDGKQTAPDDYAWYLIDEIGRLLERERELLELVRQGQQATSNCGHDWCPGDCDVCDFHWTADTEIMSTTAGCRAGLDGECDWEGWRFWRNWSRRLVSWRGV